MASRATKRWMLGMAAAFALLGLVLKLSDLRGRQALRRAGEPASAHPGAGANALARDTDRPAGPRSSLTDVASADRGGIGREAGTAGAPQPSIGDATEPGGGIRALGGHGRRRSHGSVPASREGGSLTASAVGDEASGGLGSSGLREPRGGAGSTPSGATDAAAAADVAFDSGDATYGTQAQVEIPDVGRITGAAGTMSFWLQPDWQEGNQDDATLMDLGDGRLQVIKNVGFLRFEFVDDAGNAGGIGTSIAEWREGEWHQVTAVWNGNQYSLYVDGQLVSQTIHDGRVDLPKDAKLYIGSDFPEGRPVARGTIGSVDVHNRPLGPGEVAGNYNSATGRNTARVAPGR
jgi:hypothetical protein